MYESFLWFIWRQYNSLHAEWRLLWVTRGDLHLLDRLLMEMNGSRLAFPPDSLRRCHSNQDIQNSARSRQAADRQTDTQILIWSIICKARPAFTKILKPHTSCTTPFIEVRLQFPTRRLLDELGLLTATQLRATRIYVALQVSSFRFPSKSTLNQTRHLSSQHFFR